MARLPRAALVTDNSANHCTWRSHDHRFVLESPDAKRRFLDLIREYKLRFGILVLSYCVMDNHPHLVLVSTRGQKAFSAFWQVVNQRFARWYNRVHGHRGQVVMERLRSPQIQDVRYLLTAIRYGDLNPVRAGLVRSPKDWAWSSYRHYAFGEPDELVDDAPDYLSLGTTAAERRRTYQQLFARRYWAPLLVCRIDLVVGPFIGDDAWIRARLERCGLSPPD